MKRYLILFAVCAFGMVSCLKDSYYETTATPVATFDFSDGDSLLVIPSFPVGYFYGFFNVLNEAKTELKGGFACSQRRIWWNMDSREAVSGSEEYRNDNLYMTVFEKQNDANRMNPNCYAVFYSSDNMPEHDFQFLMPQNSTGSLTPVSCVINNTAFTVAQAKGFDLSAEYPEYDKYEFKKSYTVPGENEGDPDVTVEGDFIRIVAKGYKSGQTAPTVSKKPVYLVDYIDGAQDSVLTSWKPLDLSDLGEVDFIDFDVECSESVKESQFPIYFCLDNFAAKVHIKQ